MLRELLDAFTTLPDVAPYRYDLSSKRNIRGLTSLIGVLDTRSSFSLTKLDPDREPGFIPGNDAR